MIVPMSLVFLGIFLALRLLLLVLAWSLIEPDIGTLLRLFGMGLIYDLAFLAYVLIPITLVSVRLRYYPVRREHQGWRLATRNAF
jgi:hypothetical protein